MKKVNRREFVETATAAGVAAAAAPATLFGQAPTVMTLKSVKPVVISSANGHRYKNGGTKTCVETAFGMMTGDLAREHRRARSRGFERRLRRSAQR